MKKIFLRGFSLIELLVAVTIIAILSAVGMANFQTAAQKARDSRRQSEIEQIRSAVELYRSDEGSYPANGLLEECGKDVSLENAGGNVYLQEIPCDPKDGNPYLYNATGLTYVIHASFETKGNDCTDLDDYNYCVKNP